MRVYEIVREDTIEVNEKILKFLIFCYCCVYIDERKFILLQ